MSDLVKRLREMPESMELFHMAADEIERLREDAEAIADVNRAIFLIAMGRAKRAEAENARLSAAIKQIEGGTKSMVHQAGPASA